MYEMFNMVNAYIHTTDNASAVGKMHFSRLDQSLENTRHIGRCFVCLVNDQHVTVFHSADEWRIIVDNHSFMYGRLQCQRLHRGVPRQYEG